jgi:hypothetical protein
MSDLAREFVQFLDALATPGSETRRWVAEQNLRADAADIVEGLKNRYTQGQRVRGQVTFDQRVSDELLIEVNDELVVGMRYALPAEDCQRLGFELGIWVSGILDFTLVIHCKGVTLSGKPADMNGAIQPGSVVVG